MLHATQSLAFRSALLLALAAAPLACGGESASNRGGSGGSSEATSNGGTGPTTSSTGASIGTGAGGDGSGGAASGGAGGGAEVPYPIPDWATGTPASVGLDASQLAAAADIASQDGSYCLLVIRHGVLVAETYFNGAGPSTASKSWSLAKSYTSTLVGIALARGEIHSLDDSVGDYVPAWQGDDHAAITVRDLIRMTSGLQWSAFQDYIEMATFAQDDTQFAIDLPVTDAPGSKWIYHNGGVQVIEALMLAATGMPLDQYAEQHLWSKIGMHGSWAEDPSGTDTAYANVMATCRDHARFGYLYLHGGKWAGTQVLDPSWVASAITPSQTLNRAYGYLFWLNGGTPAIDAMMNPWPGQMVPFAPPDLFAARGFGNQFIDVIPSLDMIVVRFGTDPMTNLNIPDLITDAQFQKHDAILKPVLAAVTD